MRQFAASCGVISISPLLIQDHANSYTNLDIGIYFSNSRENRKLYWEIGGTHKQSRSCFINSSLLIRMIFRRTLKQRNLKVELSPQICSIR